MTSEPVDSGRPDGSVEMPRPNVWPLVLGLGLALTAAGVALGVAFAAVGGALFVVGLAGWVVQLLPGEGHVHEEVTGPLPAPVEARPGTVEQLQAGILGHRFRLPEKVHPISAGVRGGIVGGLVMPLPALAWGLLSGHGIWYPVNLLAGMALPGIGARSVPELEHFDLTLLVLGVLIHATISVVFGLLYGVLLPTLPDLPRALAWGGLLMPLLWTAVSFGLMGIANPLLQRGVDWPWFIVSQFVFGLAAAWAVLGAGARLRPLAAGVLGGVVGGLLMPLPALLWGVLTGNGIWYPVNLLAAMVVPGLGRLPGDELHQFHAEWFGAAVAIHAGLSVAFGVLYGLLLPRLPNIPGPLAWGGLLMPLLWTAIGYGLMGVVNPVLQLRVDWFWFIVSQFVFGVAAALVVLRSAQVRIPPAGPARGEPAA
jgi:uncharacterized membrane protein YagU involved in acid resistance